jgi:hypothetical protein
MKRKTLSELFKSLLVLSLVQTPWIASAQISSVAQAPACKVQKDCSLQYKPAMEAVNEDETATDQGKLAGANQMKSRGTRDAALACSAQKTCEKKCTDPCSAKQCEDMKKKAEQLAAACTGSVQAATDADATGKAIDKAAPESTGSGLSGSMMPLIAGAAMGGLAAYMYMKNKKDDKDEDKALLPNGQVDCSKKDAYKYQGCNGYLEQQCRSSMDTPACSVFRSRYCGSSPVAGGAGGGAPNVLPIGNSGVQPEDLSGEIAVQSKDKPVKGNAGEGVGSSFCKLSFAQNFCKTAGRESCPSCVQMANMNSPACQQNPALCLAQNSPEQIHQAKTSCPTDPAFMDPTWAAGGGAQVPTQLHNGNPVVLPGQNGQPNTTVGNPKVNVGGTNFPGGGNAGSHSNASGGNPPNVIPAGGTTTASATRESNNTSGVSSYSGSGSGGVATGYNPASRTGSSREIASAGGYKSASRGPASDIQGQYGPSLFSVSAQVIRDRCSRGQFLNCP